MLFVLLCLMAAAFYCYRCERATCDVQLDILWWAVTLLVRALIYFALFHTSVMRQY